MKHAFSLATRTPGVARFLQSDMAEATRPNFHLLFWCNQRRAKVSSNYQIAFGLGALPNKKSYTRASCETHYGHDFVELRGV
jgi:hypothetical protein